MYRYFLLFVDIIRKNQPERASIRSPVPQSDLSPSLSLASLSLSSLSTYKVHFSLRVKKATFDTILSTRTRVVHGQNRTHPFTYSQWHGGFAVKS